MLEYNDERQPELKHFLRFLGTKVHLNSLTAVHDIANNRRNTPAIRHLLLCGILLFWMFAGTAFSASFSVNPVADTFVASGPTGNLSNNNYGGAGALSIAARGLPQGEFQSLLQFSLAGARSSFDAQFGSGQWTIQSVTIQLTAASPNNAIFNASSAGRFGISWMQNDGWTEGTGTPPAPGTTGITFSTLNSFLGSADEGLGTFNFNGATSGNTSYSLDLTPLFSADILSGGSLSLRMFAADSSVSYLFDARSFGTISARPLLTIVAVPEPGLPALTFVGGLVGFWRFASRRK